DHLFGRPPTAAGARGPERPFLERWLLMIRRLTPPVTGPLTILVFLALGVLFAPIAAPAPGPPGQARYIVVLKSSVSDPGAAAAKDAKAYGAQVGHVFRSAL